MSISRTSIINLILLSFTLVFLLLSGAALAYYGWIVVASPETLVVVVIPGVLAILFGLAMIFPLIVRINVILTCVLLVAFTYVAETMLHLRLIGNSGFNFGTPGVEFDRRRVVEVILDLRRTGTEAYPVLFAEALLRDDGTGTLIPSIQVDGSPVLPLGGIAGKITVYCNETGRYLIYLSDEHGFHNPPDLWHSGNIEIAALGDSITQGACDRSEENFVARIRDRHPYTLNLGMSSNGPMMELATLREYLPSLKPKTVLWFYSEENDIKPDLQRGRRAAILRKYLEPGFRQGLQENQEAIDRSLIEFADRALEREIKKRRQVSQSATTFNVKDWFLLRRLRNALGLIIGPSNKDISFFRRILKEAQATVSSWNGKLYVVYLPGYRRFISPWGRLAQDLTRVRVLQALAEIPGVSVIDLVPVFAEHPAPSSLFRFHYTTEGFGLVASEVLKALEGKLD